jgi:hypothetical protein
MLLNRSVSHIYTTAITICLTSIIQDKGGNENQVRLDLEYPGFRALDPKALSAISCGDTRKSFDEVGTVLNSRTPDDVNKISTPHSRMSSTQSHLKMLCLNSQKKESSFKCITHKHNDLVNGVFTNKIFF